ncbi:MAG: hypothetical protein QOK67_09210 [Nitrososphaeraceae archaeon]|nr:hypothetical protein [Nitrososphaeraceae archaeon]
MKNIILIVMVATFFITMSGSNLGNYILAQEGAITPEGSVNDTMSGKNATQWANGQCNIGYWISILNSSYFSFSVFTLHLLVSLKNFLIYISNK